MESSPVVSDGVVYVGSGDNSVYTLDASTGGLLWRYKTGAGVESLPTIADGVVYVGSFDSYVYALDTSTGDLPLALRDGSPVIATALPTTPRVAEAALTSTCGSTSVRGKRLRRTAVGPLTLA